MPKHKTNRGLYGYLDSLGVLATGNAVHIQEAKQRYWAQYKREWKKEKRKQLKSFTIYFSPKEAGSVRKAAASQQMSATKFIARAAMSAVGKQGSFNSALAGQVRQAVVLCSVYIEGVLEGDIKVAHKTTAILARLEQMENEVLALIVHPNCSP